MKISEYPQPPLPTPWAVALNLYTGPSLLNCIKRIGLQRVKKLILSLYLYIYFSGSLLNLAKHPASTVQILGAEKALFRALKTKQDTPKYGIIYHASLVGQANTKIKGKMSRMLAAKTSLAIRVDALGEETNADLGLGHRATLERRMKMLEENKVGY